MLNCFYQYYFEKITFFIAKRYKEYIISQSLERRLMVGQEILVLFIMVRIRALQPIFKRTLVVRFNIGL